MWCSVDDGGAWSLKYLFKEKCLAERQWSLSSQRHKLFWYETHGIMSELFNIVDYYKSSEWTLEWTFSIQEKFTMCSKLYKKFTSLQVDQLDSLSGIRILN